MIISAACGALLSKIILAEGITLAFKLQQPFDYHNVPYYILLGIVCGFTALAYARVFHNIETKFIRIRNEWMKAIRDSKSRPVNVTILRDKHEQTLTVSLDDKKRSEIDVDDTVEEGMFMCCPL